MFSLVQILYDGDCVKLPICTVHIIQIYTFSLFNYWKLAFYKEGLKESAARSTYQDLADKADKLYHAASRVDELLESAPVLPNSTVRQRS